MCMLFLVCYAMDSDCSLRVMPLAEGESRGRVHCPSAPLSYIGRAGLLPLPAALGGNIHHSNDMQFLSHIMPSFVWSCSIICYTEIFLKVAESTYRSLYGSTVILYLCWVGS